MRFRVLGALEVVGPDRRVVVPAGPRQRLLLATLLCEANRVVSADRLVEVLWGAAPPGDPAAALASQVSRLRRLLATADPAGGTALVARAPGYLLRTGPGELDAARFADLVAAARRPGVAAEEAVELLDRALGMWRGPAYAELAEVGPVAAARVRLEELRLVAVEARAAALVAAGRPQAAVPELEAFLREHPLREGALETLLRALYAAGRHTEALDRYRRYRERLNEELGLDPSVALQRLEREMLQHELPAPAGSPADEPLAPLDRLSVAYLRTPAGRRIAHATVGDGPALVVVPALVSSLDTISSGRDPRASLLERLARHTRLTLYDRCGTGLSGGEVDDFTLPASAAELVAVIEHVGGPVSLFAASQSGPVALTVAAQRPELVTRLVLFGTYARAGQTFGNPRLADALVRLAEAHWGMGARMVADLYRPGCSPAAADHLGRVLAEAAPARVAAGYLREVYRVDVAELLPRVAAPCLLMHYRGDRVIPFRGSEQLAAGLPDARLQPLDGPYHLPDVADLDRIVAAIVDFLAEQPAGPAPPTRA
jgi:DNA-binding SARP family transcriptional activator